MGINREVIEKLFQEAVSEVIKDHAQKGSPIVYMKENGSEVFEALLDPETLEPIWEKVVKMKAE